MNRQEGRVHAQLVQDEERRYVLKITNATEASNASTAVAVDEACKDSAAFEKHEIDSQLLQTAKREWPSLYEHDKELLRCGKRKAMRDGATLRSRVVMAEWFRRAKVMCAIWSDQGRDT